MIAALATGIAMWLERGLHVHVVLAAAGAPLWAYLGWRARHYWGRVRGSRTQARSSTSRACPICFRGGDGHVMDKPSREARMGQYASMGLIVGLILPAMLPEHVGTSILQSRVLYFVLAGICAVVGALVGFLIDLIDRIE